jgi:hypothetical protein
MQPLEWLQGYKAYLVLTAYCIFVMATGQVPEGSEDGGVLGFSYEAIEKAILAQVAMAAKAKWNRVTAGS